MVGDALLSELERQEKYLAQLPENYEFPLFNARQAVESQRRSGYKDTAAASREIVDNAIEAGATHVDVVFDTAKAKNNKRSVTAVAFIDDGAGMRPRMARYALSWGGGTHFEDPEFIGRFGFGLPNASALAISRRIGSSSTGRRVRAARAVVACHTDANTNEPVSFAVSSPNGPRLHIRAEQSM
jgi:Histidine kinase-, DNA gyrase B-, and HSP90-like ATPase